MNFKPLTIIEGRAESGALTISVSASLEQHNRAEKQRAELEKLIEERAAECRKSGLESP